MAGSSMQLEDWLDDLCVRFIINLPEEDLSSVARICFQVEEAQWFYEDFIRPLDPALPSMSLRTFCLRIFQHCPLLAQFSVENHTKAFEEFLEYKTRVPVRGAIMLNHEMDSAVLVKGWKKGASWGFPGGKINKDEDDMDCAIREVYEETGLNLRQAGLVPKRPKYIELPIKNHQVRLYVFRDVPMDTNFEPQTRKEISKIEWYNLSELPTFRRKGGQNDAPAATGANKFYMVAPFMVPLKKWVGSQKKIDERRTVSEQVYLQPVATIEETATEDDTWAHPAPAAPSKEASINTLDGATRELQRLLKMQPPTQGVQQQPSNVEDKGSALLSILQSRNSGPAMAPQPNPHNAMDLGAGQVPQPRTQHHPNNHQAFPHAGHQPPPSFPLPSNNAASWNSSQHHPRGDQPFGSYQGLNHQQYGNNQAALVHPQPLPPQVQRSVFNKSAFQDGSSNSHSGAPAQGSQFVAQQAQMPPPQAQMPHPAHGGQAKPLNGQSMALLNAFKRGPAPSSAAQPPIPDNNRPAPQAAYSPYGQPASYGHPGAPQAVPEPHNAGKSAYQHKSPAELAAGSKPQADQHRSALLGMFKKEAPDTIPSQQYGINQAPTTKPVQPNQAGKEVLAQLQAQTQYNYGKPVPAGRPAHSSSGPGNAMSLDQLSIQPRPAQTGTHMVGVSGNTMPRQARSSHQSPAGTQPQPVRILQRGQTLQQPGQGDQQPASAKSSPYTDQAQAKSSHVASSPAMTSPGLQNRRPGPGSTDQKQQLLSLFGKPQGGSPASAEASAEPPRGRMLSLASGSEERRGSQTPISPADQSFLLGYLQSVTNNASR